jgi:hypothetical protein
VCSETILFALSDEHGCARISRLQLRQAVQNAPHVTELVESTSIAIRTSLEKPLIRTPHDLEEKAGLFVAIFVSELGGDRLQCSLRPEATVTRCADHSIL